MGTYSALGPLIKETVERLEGEEKKTLERLLKAPLQPSRADVLAKKMDDK